MKIAVCIPSKGEWQVDFATRLIDLLSYTNSARPDWSVQIDCACSSLLLQNRYDLAVRAKRAECTYILWLDDDMTFPADTLVRLVGHERSLVAANYVSRKLPLTTHAAHEGRKLGVGVGLGEADHAGLGICLTDISVFREADEPWFYFGWNPKDKQFVGEDVWFFRKAKAAGFQLYIDHDLSKEIGHLGRFEFTHEMAVRG